MARIWDLRYSMAKSLYCIDGEQQKVNFSLLPPQVKKFAVPENLSSKRSNKLCLSTSQPGEPFGEHGSVNLWLLDMLVVSFFQLCELSAICFQDLLEFCGFLFFFLGRADCWRPEWSDPYLGSKNRPQ